MFEFVCRARRLINYGVGAPPILPPAEAQTRYGSPDQTGKFTPNPNVRAPSWPFGLNFLQFSFEQPTRSRSQSPNFYRRV